MDGLKLIYPIVSDYYSQSQIDDQLTTLSGNLVIYIDSKDSLEYARLITTSGDLVSWVLSKNYATYDQLVSTSGTLVALVDTVSGAIVSQIPSLAGYATQTWVTDQDYATQSQLTSTSGYLISYINTVSGNIVAQIPSLTGYATQAWANTNFIDTGEMTTISGDIVAKIPTDYVTLQKLTTTSGDIIDHIWGSTGPISVPMGSGIFTGHVGTTIIHNLNDINHITIVTPAGADIFDSATSSKVGSVYVNVGSIQDVIYNTGGPTSSGIPFRWSIISGEHLVASGITHHHELSGLADDDHTQYFLANGGREVSGNILPEMTGASGVVSARDIGSSTQKFKDVWTHDLHVDAGSLYVNGKKVIEDISDTITVSTDPDQDLAIKTYGTGDINLISEHLVISQGRGGLEFNVPSTQPSKQMTFNSYSANGDIAFNAVGSNGNVYFLAYGIVDFTAETVSMNANLSVAGNVDFYSFTISGSAPQGEYLRANGTSYISSPILLSDLPSDVITLSELTTTSGDIQSALTYPENLTIRGSLTVGSGAQSLQRLNVGYGDIGFTPVDDPSSSISGSVGASGILTGNYYYKATYTTAAGETGFGVISNLVQPSGQQVELSSIPISPNQFVTGRKIYRTKGDNSEFYYLLTSISGNSPATYTDNATDTSLGSIYMVDRPNSTAGRIFWANELVFTLDDYNIGIGKYALRNVTMGQKNIAIGDNALQSLTYGNHNVALGRDAGMADNGNQNVFIGSWAGRSNTGGSNTYLGFSSGFNNANGNNNIFIGSKAGYSETGSYKFVVSYLNTGNYMYGDMDVGSTGGTLYLRGGFYPQADLTYDLGKSNLRWNNLYSSNAYAHNSLTVGSGVSSPHRLTIGYGDINFIPLAVPPACSLALGASGVLTGDYYYRVTYTTAYGETGFGTVSALIQPAGHQVDLSSIPVSSSQFVTGRKIYRTKAGSGYLYLLTTLNNNTTTTYVDNATDDSLGTTGRYVRPNTTAGRIYWDGSPALTMNDLNIGIGRWSLQSVAEGQQNIAIGQNSLYYLTAGHNNVAVGRDCGGQTNGNYNTFVGSLSAYVSTLSYNTMVGYATGYTNVSGNYNILLGYCAGFNELGSKKFYVACSTTTPYMYGDMDTTSTGGTLYLRGSLYPQADNIYQCGGASNRWTDVWAVNGSIQTSDVNLKENIQDCQLGLDFVNELEPKTFKWKDYTTSEEVPISDPYEDENGIMQPAVTTMTDVSHTFKRKHFGFVAQDIKSLLDSRGIDTSDFAPYVLDENGVSHLRTGELVPILTKAIKDLDAKYSSEMSTLLTMVSGLEARLTALGG